VSDARPTTIPTDALGRVPELACVVELPVLGIPTRFETNDPALGRLIERTFGRWRATPPASPSAVSSSPDRSPAAASGDGASEDAQPGEPTAAEPAVSEPAVVRFLVEPGTEGAGRASIRYRVASGGRVFLTTPGSLGCADPARRETSAWVTRALVDDTQHFRHGVLEGLTIALLSRLDRQPVHAAAVARDGSALLLAGPSGAGKSTLTYACARAGLDVLAEDVVYAQLEPRLRVWGSTPYLHLPAESLAHFPELRATATVRLPNGKEKIVVDLHGDGGRALPFADRVAVCMLRRTDAAEPTLKRLDAAEVERALGARLESGFDLFADTLPPVHRALAGKGGWRLDVTGGPDRCLDLILQVFEDVAATSTTSR
jgi:hypothetical protein